MSATSVTTSPVALDLDGMPDIGSTGQTLVCQNLGPDDLYADFSDEVGPDTGVLIAAGTVWEIASYIPSRPLYIVSEGTSDVRYLVVN